MIYMFDGCPLLLDAIPPQYMVRVGKKYQLPNKTVSLVQVFRLPQQYE
jgi:hypothetical protein